MPRRLDAADKWLAAHDPEYRQRRRPCAEVGAPTEWTLGCWDAPDDADTDAGWVASTFADYSGGWLMPRFAAAVFVRCEERAIGERERIARVRAECPGIAKTWRERDRERRRTPEGRKRERERKRAERFRLKPVEPVQVTPRRTGKRRKVQRPEWAWTDLFSWRAA